MRLFGTSKIINNELIIGGVSTIELAKQYGTPLYVYDEEGIEDKIKVFKDNFNSSKFKTRIIYAGKAFLSAHMIQLLSSHQLSLDVVSGGELYLAAQSGYDLKDVYFHGNAKTKQELELAVQENVGTIVLDNVSEAAVLNDILTKEDKIQRVLLRVNPTIETDTHKYIQTSNEDSKFGLNFDETAAFLTDLDQYPQLDFKGFHCHIGSQIFDQEAYFTEASSMVEFYSQMEERFNLSLDELNLGGGFGVYYTDADTPFELGEFLQTYIQKLEILIDEYAINVKTVSIEPGRSLINDFGTMLYGITHIKPSTHFDFIFIDGGMNDNLRPALYEANYLATVANKMEEEGTNDYRIAGKLCESGDVLIEQVKLPKVDQNDIIAIPSTGAYTQSMASNYNKIPRPAVVFVKNGNVKVAVKRETFADLIRNEVL